MMEITGFAATKPKTELTKHTYTDSIDKNEVAVKISHCGICHSDLHLIDNEWGMSNYPFIPGHEIVGVVTKKGAEVSHLEKGDRVGVGWQCGSCHSCEWCSQGEQHNCPEQQPTCIGRNGGYADSIIVDSAFAIRIPTELESAHAAPMMCGGITVFTPLYTYAKPGDKVGVIGLGGLGHFAVLFADAMGCDVTVFSTSPEKEKEAYALGANRFTTKVDEDVDVIINTAPARLPWGKYVGALRPKGTFVQVGASPAPIEIESFSLLASDKKIVGSHIGSPDMIRRMVRFAAVNNVKPRIELFGLEDVNDAVQHVKDGEARYRAVLER